MWLDKKVIQNYPITEKAISYIKGALIITLKDLEERLEDWRSKRCILVPINKVITFRLI